MDIRHLVDRLEDLIDEGRHMPMSKYTLIDEERALEIIDQMRISIPEEIEKSNRVLGERERILAQAHEEAARYIQKKRDETNHKIANEPTVQAAQNHAANIIEQARQDAEKITQEADTYVVQVLSALKQRLEKIGREVDNGIGVVNTQPAMQNSPDSFAPPVATQALADEEQVSVERLPEQNKRQ